MFGYRPSERPPKVLGPVLGACLCVLASGTARADGPYEGQWREGPMSIQVAVQSWGGDCGPRPQSTTTGGGGTFRVSQAGDQLTFHLRSERTTRACWSENRAVRRVSSSYQAGTWRIVCRTPADDSRGETGTYTIQAIGDDRLQFRDVSQYDWQLNESRCLATITTTQAFTRVGGGQAQTPPPTTTPPPERCTAGAPARLVLRPDAADLPPGGEQCFTARVVDAAGCTVRSRIAFAVAQGDPGRVEGSCYHAPDAPGSARVIASAGSLRGEARMTVRTMDLSDLIARRTETGSVGSGAPDEDASTQTAARVSAREADEGPSLLWPAIVLGIAILLVLVALLLLRRRDGGAKSKKSIGGLPGVEIPEIDRSSGAPRPAPEPVAEISAGPVGEDMICPACRRGFPPGSERCPHDDTALMAYRDFAAGKRPDGAAAQSVCPTCGKRYPVTVKFCGEDGATLVPASDGAEPNSTQG